MNKLNYSAQVSQVKTQNMACVWRPEHTSDTGPHLATFPACLSQGPGSLLWVSQTSWVRNFWKMPLSTSDLPAVMGWNYRCVDSMTVCVIISLVPQVFTHWAICLAPQEGSSMSVCVSFLDAKMRMCECYTTPKFLFVWVLLFFFWPGPAPAAFSDLMSHTLSC